MSFVTTWNQNMEKKHNNAVQIDTDSFTVYIKTEDVYNDIGEDVGGRFNN